MNDKEVFRKVFNFVKSLNNNNKAVWTDKYGNTSVMIGKNLLPDLFQEWERSSQNYIVLISPIIKDRIDIHIDCLFEKSFVKNVSKIVSIGGAKEHNVAKEFLFKNNKIEFITVPIPLSNDSFCTNRFSLQFGNIMCSSLGSIYPSKIIIDLNLLCAIDNDLSARGIGEVVGLYYSVWDYYSVRKLSPPKELVSNIERDISRLISAVNNSAKEFLRLLSLELIKKCFIMRVFDDHQIGAGGDHIIAYGIEHYFRNVNKFDKEFFHGKLVYWGSVVMAALFPEWKYGFFSLQNLINIGQKLNLIDYNDLELLIYLISKRIIPHLAIKTRPKRQTSLSTITQDRVKEGIVRLEACLNNIKDEEYHEP